MSAGRAKNLLDVLQRAEGFFQERLGLDRPGARLDAQVLLAHVLECDRVQLYVQHDRPLTEGELSVYRDLVRRRAMHEPVAYLVGQREFWSLPIRVDRRVLIPRPDSESLMELALELSKDTPPARFVDVGTGSGALACALAVEFSEARGLALDRDAGALAVAAANIEQLGFASRVECLQSDLLTAVRGEVDLLVANLPYIPRGQMGALASDIRDFEPAIALDGGVDGLELIRRLVDGLGAALSPGGWALLEVGAGQAVEVEGMLEGAGLQDLRIRRDLGGVERVVAARKRG